MTIFDLIGKSVKECLTSFVNEPITQKNVAVVKETVAQGLRRFWRERGVRFPMRLPVTARTVRARIGELKCKEIPNEAVLFLNGQFVDAEVRLPTQQLFLYIDYDGYFEHRGQRWPATNTETVVGVTLSN